MSLTVTIIPLVKQVLLLWAWKGLDILESTHENSFKTTWKLAISTLLLMLLNFETLELRGDIFHFWKRNRGSFNLSLTKTSSLWLTEQVLVSNDKSTTWCMKFYPLAGKDTFAIFNFHVTANLKIETKRCFQLSKVHSRKRFVWLKMPAGKLNINQKDNDQILLTCQGWLIWKWLYGKTLPVL